MKDPTFRGKPSKTHVIWRRGKGDAAKRFDEDGLRRWCSAHGVEFETGKRVDHERSPDPRAQYRLVFSWAKEEGESFEIGDREWNIEPQKTPRTFVEIDSKGEMRVKSWDDEFVLDVHEMWWDGASLVFKAAEFDGTKRLRASKLKP